MKFYHESVLINSLNFIEKSENDFKNKYISTDRIKQMLQKYFFFQIKFREFFKTSIKNSNLNILNQDNTSTNKAITKKNKHQCFVNFIIQKTFEEGKIISNAEIVLYKFCLMIMRQHSHHHRKRNTNLIPTILYIFPL